jgi:hypothetical protein
MIIPEPTPWVLFAEAMLLCVLVARDRARPEEPPRPIILPRLSA